MRFEILSFVALTALALVLATLPRNLQLYAFEDGQQIGCVTSKGWFTYNLQWCGIFRSQLTRDPYSQLKGVDWCSIDGTVECDPNSGVLGEFFQSGNDLATDIGGTAFSIDKLPPNKTDRTGVPMAVGNGGTTQLTLNVKATGG